MHTMNAYFKEKMILLGVLLLAFAVTYAVPTLAVSPAGASANQIGTKGPYQGTDAGNIGVEAGYIYEVNVTGNMSTYHWAGVYGNATGYLLLADQTGANVMYKWPAKANYVYFTELTTLDLAGLGAASCSDVENKYDYLSSASDDCDRTFTISSYSWNTKIGPTGVSTIAAQTYDDAGTPTWYTLALKDGSGNIVFAAEANPSFGKAFDGTDVNYQAILPDKGENGNTTATTYYIWIELF